VDVKVIPQKSFTTLLHILHIGPLQYPQICTPHFTIMLNKWHWHTVLILVGSRLLFCVMYINLYIVFCCSHGNAVDLGQMTSFLVGLGSRLRCNIMTYDYCGYGRSTGSVSESNLYADIEAAWQCLGKRFGICAENVILYGQSIGTVPTVDLAARYELGGIILHSPLMSGMRVAFPETKRTWWFDAFPR